MADKEHMELVERNCTRCAKKFDPDDFFRGFTGRQHPTPRYHLGRVGFIGSIDGPEGADPLLKSEAFPLCAGCYRGLVRLLKAGAAAQLSQRDETTLATNDQFLAPLPVCETDLVRYHTGDGRIVEVLESHTIELVRSDRAIRRE